MFSSWLQVGAEVAGPVLPSLLQSREPPLGQGTRSHRSAWSVQAGSVRNEQHHWSKNLTAGWKRFHQMRFK